MFIDLKEVIDCYLRSQENKIEQEPLDFKEGDDEKLWEWWEKHRKERAKLLILPYGIKIIDGLFFYLLENFGTKLLLLAFENYSKRQKKEECADYTAILNEVMPHICLKYLKKNIKLFNKEVNELAFKEMAKDMEIGVHIAKMRAIRGLVC